MASFNAFLTGIDSDALFPALHGGSFSVVAKEADHFTIRYVSDGLLVHFGSDGSTFTYNGDTPTGGTFNQITLTSGGQIPLTLASWTGFASTALTSFNSTALADDLLDGQDILTGATADDILRGHGGPDIYIGGAGDDVFEIGANSNGAEVHGANLNGTGGAGETDTIRVLDSLLLGTGSVTDIDALVFAAPSASSVAVGVESATLSGFSDTLAVSGNAQINLLSVDAIGPAVNLDLSSWSFVNWTAGVDEVTIGDTNCADTIVGTVVDDRIFASGGLDVFVGKGGNDTFHLANGTNPAAIHGSNADGTGVSSEVNLIDPGSSPRDLRTVTLSNIDGFTSSSGGTIDLDPSTGAITGRVGAVVALGADQFGAPIDVNARIVGATGIGDPDIPFGFEIVGAKSFDASGWQLTKTSADSILHVTGTGAADQVKGWAAADVVVLAGGSDFASTGAGQDYIFAGEGNDTLVGGNGADALFGGNGIDTVSYGASPVGVRVSLTLTTAQLGGHAAGDVLTGIENVIGSATADLLAGGATANWLTGGRGRDVLIGGQGADRFDFNAILDSITGAKRDVIRDFHRGQHDRIDIAGIDANSHLHGNQAFHFIGGQHFHSAANHPVYGELRFEKGLVEGDVNGDGHADFQINVLHAASLAVGDFFL